MSDVWTMGTIARLERELMERDREHLAKSGWYDVERSGRKSGQGLVARMSNVLARRSTQPAAKAASEPVPRMPNLTHLIPAEERQRAMRIAEGQPVCYAVAGQDDDNWAA